MWFTSVLLAHVRQFAVNIVELVVFISLFFEIFLHFVIICAYYRNNFTVIESVILRLLYAKPHIIALFSIPCVICCGGCVCVHANCSETRGCINAYAQFCRRLVASR